MYSILAAAALAASMSSAHLGEPGSHRCFPGFSPDAGNGLLATHPPEDFSRVYTPGASEFSGRLWVGDDVKDIRSRRAWRGNPGTTAYGAVGAGHEQVRVQVGHVAVSISPWDKVEQEGLKNWERARQEWLAERGYTGGVRTFVNPKRTRAITREAGTVAASDANRGGAGELPAPSATIRLRNPDQQSGVIRKVEAGVAGGVRLISGDSPVRISWPMQARAEVVDRAIARGLTESEKEETEVATAQK